MPSFAYLRPSDEPSDEVEGRSDNQQAPGTMSDAGSASSCLAALDGGDIWDLGVQLETMLSL